MKKILTIFLTAMLAFASAAYSAQKIEDIPWDESHIKQLRAFKKSAVLRFFVHQEDPDGEQDWSEGMIEFDWYPTGNGKYELAVNSQTGPDIAGLTIYWQEAPGKFRSQQFGVVTYAGEEWYKGPEFADLNHDGKEELILFDSLDYSENIFRRKFIPNGAWPKVYRLRDGKYVEASCDFPNFYDNKILPQLNTAAIKARKDRRCRRGKGQTVSPIRSERRLLATARAVFGRPDYVP